MKNKARNKKIAKKILGVVSKGNFPGRQFSGEGDFPGVIVLGTVLRIQFEAYLRTFSYIRMTINKAFNQIFLLNYMPFFK